jgi:NAD+ synthase (glutamine-hydrolysing)
MTHNGKESTQLIKIVLAQINPTIGDIRGNLAIIQNEIIYATQNNVDVIVFPELAMVGYPPRDLLYNDELWSNQEVALQKLQLFLKQLNKPITVIVGGIQEVKGPILQHYNAAYVLHKGKILDVIHKKLLPCYDVFDETRYFTPGNPSISKPTYIPTAAGLIAFDILICEDIWNFGYPQRASWMSPGTYPCDPTDNLKGNGPIIVLNASPYWEGKIAATRTLLAQISTKTNRMIAWCNQVGAHDDIVFGGYSMFVAPNNQIMGKAFAPDSLMAEIDPYTANNIRTTGYEMWQINGEQQPVIKIHTPNIRQIDFEDLDTYYLFSALKLSLQDYCRRTGFKKIVFGASGGIDSAVVGAIAAIALGGDNCTAITMPSRWSSPGSWEDAESLAQKCGMHFMVQPISVAHESVKSILLVNGKQKFIHGVTDENIQPRLRALLLMAESNENDSLLLTTGNKSELSVGYCTIYGDMAGGFALLSDVWKTQVFQLARFINKYYDLIPANSISKPPSAELKADQKDSDTLPEYDKLDPLLQMLLHYVPIDEIIKQTNLPESQILSIIKMLNRAEYKRSQASIGPKVSSRSFGSGWRIPIAKNINFIS